MEKPMTKIKKLLGFTKLQELADYLGMSIHVLNNINTGRRNQTLYSAYISIAKALEMIPNAENKRLIFSHTPKPKLRLAQKYKRKENLTKKMSELDLELQNKFEELAEMFAQYSAMKEALSKIEDI